MAFDNKEIEIKIRLDNDTLSTIRESLVKVATFKGATSQVDTYFVPKNENFLLEQFPFKWLSIRQRNGKSILNFKHFFPEGAEKHVYSDEFETELSNPIAMKSILNELGINEVIEVNKRRETFLVDDRYEIVLDTVKDLGSFLEIEAMKDMGTPEVTKQEMLDFLKSVGINKFEIDYRGYPFQLMKKTDKPWEI